MKKILLKNIDKIIQHIRKLINEFQKIDLLVLTGGFAKWNLLKEELKNNFNYPYKELIDPEVSIMKGAAIYGIKPNQIVSRKAPYTIGTKVYSTRREGTECRNRREGKCEYFDIFKYKGQDIKNNEEVLHEYTPLSEDQDSGNIQLYYSTSKEPVYINEKDNFLISEFSIPSKEKHIPINERIVEVKMGIRSLYNIMCKKYNFRRKS